MFTTTGIGDSYRLCIRHIKAYVLANSGRYISDDDPYSEAQFKTLTKKLVLRARFESLADARAHCTSFFAWYSPVH